jgi:hypothetical protein
VSCALLLFERVMDGIEVTSYAGCGSIAMSPLCTMLYDAEEFDERTPTPGMLVL